MLAVDFGNEPVNNRHLRDYLAEHKYPVSELPHAFMSLGREFESKFEEAEAVGDGISYDSDGACRLRSRHFHARQKEPRSGRRRDG